MIFSSSRNSVTWDELSLSCEIYQLFLRLMRLDFSVHPLYFRCAFFFLQFFLTKSLQLSFVQSVYKCSISMNCFTRSLDIVWSDSVIFLSGWIGRSLFTALIKLYPDDDCVASFYRWLNKWYWLYGFDRDFLSWNEGNSLQEAWQSCFVSLA